MSPKITIIDYGVGNLQSLKKAFEFLGVGAIVSEDGKKIAVSDAIILPGVGSYQAGMRGLKERGLTDVVKDFALSGKPTLGICLGAQLMLSEGNEFGNFPGLGIISGRVDKFSNLSNNEKIPQVGWNSIYPPLSTDWRGTILGGLEKGFDAYFVHSYILIPEGAENILGLSSYGGQEFCSVVRKRNVYGCQFHPEKSGSIGLSIIENFINLTKNYA